MHPCAPPAVPPKPTLERTDHVLDLLDEGKRLVRRVFRAILQPPPGQVVDPYALFPDAFLLELGAIFLLAGWERAGWGPHLQPGLPTAEDALGDLSRRLEESGDAAFITASTEATARIYEAAIRDLAWTGKARLGADVAIVADEDGPLLEALADFLWAHRTLPQHRS